MLHLSYKLVPSWCGKQVKPSLRRGIDCVFIKTKWGCPFKQHRPWCRFDIVAEAEAVIIDLSGWYGDMPHLAHKRSKVPKVGESCGKLEVHVPPVSVLMLHHCTMWIHKLFWALALAASCHSLWMFIFHMCACTAGSMGVHAYTHGHGHMEDFWNLSDMHPHSTRASAST